MWVPNGTIQDYLVDVYFTEIIITPGKPISLDLDVILRTPDLLPSVDHILPLFLQWKDCLGGVLLGHATFSQGNPRDPSSIYLRSFDQVTLPSPPETMYTPLLVVPKLVNPFTQGVGLDIDVFFPNAGPLHVELGSLGINLFENGKQIGHVNLEINTVNVLEGGNTQRGNRIPINVRLSLGLISLFQTLEDLITGAKHLGIY